MPNGKIRVIFEPQGRTIHAEKGIRLFEAAARAGLTLDMPCGGAGNCGKCRARIMDGAPAPTDAERRVFTASELADGWRLACQTSLHSRATVYIPESSIFGGRVQIHVDAGAGETADISPLVRKTYVALPPPTLADEAADMVRLERVIGPFEADLGLLRAVPRALRAADFKGTAVMADHHLIAFEPGDTTDACYGAAFDIGTTTLVGVLLHLVTGKERAVTSSINPQIIFGDDVLSRITLTIQRGDGLDNLQSALLRTINDMLADLCRAAGLALDNVYEVTFSGNTTMEHLLCGISPAQLGQAPFAPVFGRGIALPATAMGVNIHPRGMAYVFPVIGGFVGGDTVAGMLATQIADAPGPSIMVDIGTNGEIVLAHEGRLWAASTAAGPAFEGARISCGMRATRGAIEKVTITDDVHCGVIDGAPPVGLCGSGLIDLVAELLRRGIIAPDGRILPPETLPGNVPDALRHRTQVNQEGEARFVLAANARGKESAEVALTQRDVRELQLASGAIRAGIAILLKFAGLAMGDVAQVLVAGGFGSFIRRSNAQRIGLLPPELPHQRIRYVGNTSLSGARWALLSLEARGRAEILARRAEHVELSTDPDFAMEFAMAMTFPDSDTPG